MKVLAPLAFFCLMITTVNADQPNILFLLSDDQCFETIGHNGQTDIDTPNLDRLAEQGTQFSHAYNMGAWAGARRAATAFCLALPQVGFTKPPKSPPVLVSSYLTVSPLPRK